MNLNGRFSVCSVRVVSVVRRRAVGFWSAALAGFLFSLVIPPIDKSFISTSNLVPVIIAFSYGLKRNSNSC